MNMPKATDQATRAYDRRIQDIDTELQHMHEELVEDISDTEARLKMLTEQLGGVKSRMHRTPEAIH